MSDSEITTDHGTAGERVMRGLAWLDEHGARYGLDHSRVNLATLDMRAPMGCMLAKSAGDGRGYWDVLRDMHGPDDCYGLDAEDWAARHGFTRMHLDGVAWGELDAAWVAILDTRRGNPGRVWEESSTGSPWAW